MPHHAAILLVDDEPDVIAVLAPALARAGYAVASAADGAEAWEYLQHHAPDLVVLDVVMPAMDGHELLRRMRLAGKLTPVILLSQVGGSAERARTLDAGADDYLNKPFDQLELLARIRAVLWRVGVGARLATARTLLSGPLRLDRAARRAWRGSEECALTPRAFAVLEHLMGRPGELVTAEQLLSAVWGWDDPAGAGALRTRVAELRRALADDAAQPRYIETVAGGGYRFVGPVEVGP